MTSRHHSLSLVVSNRGTPLAGVDQHQPAREGPQMSFSKDLDRSRRKRRVPLDPYRMKREFPERWASYLHATFRNPEAVATAFDVRFQTACNWWAGTNAASGDKVALAALNDPVGFARAMRNDKGKAA